MSAVPIAPVSAAAWLKQVARPWRRLTLLAGLLSVADVVPAIGFAAGLALTIANLTVSPAAAAPWLALAVFSLVARGLIGQAAVIVGARLGRAIKTDVRGRLLSDLFGRGRRSGDRLTALVEGVGALDGYYSRFAPLRLAAGASPLLIIAAAAIASPVSAGVLLFTLFPFIVGMALAGTAAAGESRRQFQALERLSGLFIDRIRTLPAILAFDAVGRTTAQIAQASDELERRTTRVMRIAFLSSGVLEFFSALSVALIAVYCGFNLLRLLPFPVPETLDLPRAFFVLALAPEVYAPLRRLAAAYHDRQAAEAAVPSMITPDPRPAPVPALRAPFGDLAPAIHFHDVAIAYDDAAPVIDGFDLDITSGQIVAVMGASGAGKSSLLHLLLGLAPLTRGEVEVGGERLGLCGDIAGRVAWASQHPIVAPGTLAENIALADRTACPGRIALAARTAGLSGDLDRCIDERGGGLSGGERRRLGLARAILKRAPLLLLDEPTANLDPAAERAMLDVIRQAVRGRTTLIATHSPAVAALADRVVRL
ncbi:thiol reductant ABC exporter subunit CydD [Brevundimonas sp. PWP3-1b1]|uniref:thiol reductant ABC exporter subunit CydD n=1 Tax=unclassified Brevundimonas TaxID=2622653 RepID=UPI003CF3C44E